MNVPALIFRKSTFASLYATAFLLLAVVDASAGDKTPPKEDLYGDPLPQGATARLGTQRWRHEADVTFVAYANDGKEVLTSCGDGIVCVWEAKTGKKLRSFGDKVDLNKTYPSLSRSSKLYDPFDRPEVVHFAASPDGKMVACKASDGELHLWDVATGKDVRTIKHAKDATIVNFCFTLDNKNVIVNEIDERYSAFRTKLWDAATGEMVFNRARKDGNRRSSGSAEGSGSEDGPSPYSQNGDAFLSPDGMVSGHWQLKVDREQKATKCLTLWNLKDNKELKKISIPMGEDESWQDWDEFESPSIFTPDANCVVTGQFDGTLRLYDIGEGKEIRQIGEPKGSGRHRQAMMEPVSISPDGKMLLARFIDATYQLYDIASGKELHKFGEPQSEDVRELMMERRWRQRRMAEELMSEFSHDISYSWSPDSKTLVQGQGNVVRFWSIETGKINDLGAGHVGEVTTILPAAVGNSVYTLGVDKTLRKWNAETSKEQQKTELGQDIAECLLLSPSRAVVMKTGGSMSLWDPIQHEDVRSLIKVGDDEYDPRYYYSRYSPRRVWSVASDQRTFVIADASLLLHAFNLENGDELRPVVTKKSLGVKDWRTHEGVCGLACSPDGRFAAARVDVGGDRYERRYASGEEDMTPAKVVVRLYDMTTGRDLWEVNAKSPECHDLAFSPSGRAIALVEGAGDSVALFEASTGKERWRVQTAAINCRFSADGLFLALGTDEGGVKVLDARDGNEIAAFKGHLGHVTSLAFDAEAGTLFSGGVDGTVLAWDTSAQVTKARPRSPLNVDDAKSAWDDLAKSDAGAAHQAIIGLAASPKQTIALLKERLKPVKTVEETQLDKLVAQLDHDDFTTRQEAFRDLARIGDRARDALEEALEKDPPAEARKHIDQLLAGLDPGSPLPDVLRDLRAIEVLETMATPEARAILESLSKGARGNRLTREAARVLKHMEK